MKASIRARRSLVLSENSKNKTSPLTASLGRFHNPLALATKAFVGGNVYLIQDVAQVLVATAVQVGLHPVGDPGGEILDFGLAHIFFEDVDLHPTIVPVLTCRADRAVG